MGEFWGRQLSPRTFLGLADKAPSYRDILTCEQCCHFERTIKKMFLIEKSEKVE